MKKPSRKLPMIPEPPPKLNKPLDFEAILARANHMYAAKRMNVHDMSYTAPEALPRIESQQVKCILRALVDAINESCAAP